MRSSQVKGFGIGQQLLLEAQSRYSGGLWDPFTRVRDGPAVCYKKHIYSRSLHWCSQIYRCIEFMATTSSFKCLITFAGINGDTWAPQTVAPHQSTLDTKLRTSHLTLLTPVKMESTHCYHSTIPRSAFHWIHDSDDSDPQKKLKPSITQVHPMNDRVHLQPFSPITILLLQTLTRLDLLLSFQKPK